MSKGWSYDSGDWWIICDVCSKKIKASESKQRWDGLIVCPDDWELRHPQDFLKVKEDKITVPFSRPRPTDSFIFSCDPISSSSIAGYSKVGCWVTGRSYKDYRFATLSEFLTYFGGT